MTGRGSASVAFAKETSFTGSLVDADTDGTPEYYVPGRDITVEELELNNQSERARTPSDTEPVDSHRGPVEGRARLTWTMNADTHGDVMDIVFNTSSPYAFDATAAVSSSRWFMGVDYPGGVAERELVGCIPQEYEITYEATANTVEESVTFMYADENKNTTLSPSSVVKPSDGSSVAFHGASLDLDNTTVAKLQSATLSWSTIARMQPGPDPIAVDATIAQPEPTLETEAIFDGDDHLSLAYGGSSATSPQDTISSVPGSLSFSSAGSTVATYDFPQCEPVAYNWSDLVNGENDLREPITWHVNGGVTVS